VPTIEQATQEQFSNSFLSALDASSARTTQVVESLRQVLVARIEAVDCTAARLFATQIVVRPGPNWMFHVTIH
jgi:hypothetical protein